MRWFLAASLWLGAAPAWAGFSHADKGTSGAQFLSLGAGARAEGMGQAYVAVADEASAIYWNPAALSRIEAHSASFMHAALEGGVDYEFLGYGQKLGGWGAVGGGVQYLSQPKIDETDAAGFALGNTFHPNDFAASLGYAYTFQQPGLLQGTSLGLTGKFIQSTITKSAQTVGVDLGYLSAPFQIWYGDFRVAYAIRNIGGTLRFAQAGDSLPLDLDLGVSWALSGNWLLAADFNEPVNNAAYFCLGGEYRYAINEITSVSGRLGMDSRSFSDADGFNGVTFGVGGKFRGWGLDYAFAPLGTLGSAHRVSVNVSF